MVEAMVDEAGDGCALEAEMVGVNCMSRLTAMMSSMEHTQNSFVFVTQSCKFVICDCDNQDMGMHLKHV